MSNAPTDVLDVDSLMDHVESDKTLLSELVDLFNTFSPELMEKTRDAIEQEDCSAIREAAHLIKGAVSNFYATKAVESAKNLEFAGRDNRLDEAQGLYDRLEQNIDELNGMLGELLND